MAALTPQQVRKLLQTSDDALVPRIVALGTTAEELATAFVCAKCDDELLRELGRLPSGRAAEVLEILRSSRSHGNES
jgi:hypothetical protein